MDIFVSRISITLVFLFTLLIHDFVFAEEDIIEPINSEPHIYDVFVPEYNDAVEAEAGDYDRFILPALLLIFAFISLIYSEYAKESERSRWRRLAALFILLALIMGSIILAQDRGGRQQEENDTQTRTRNGQCSLSAEFALRVMPPNATGNEQDLTFVLLNPGIRVDSNGHLLMKNKNVSVAPYPGTLTFTFYRGAAGTTQFHRRSQLITSDADLRQFLAPNPPRMNAPNGIAHNNTPITERLRAVVDYDPQGIQDDCDPISSELTVTWRYNGAPRNFSWEPMNQLQSSIKVPRHRSRVRVAPDIVDETTGFPGLINKATHTTVFFKVDDPFSCCGAANKNYTIVQFVRHRWKLGNGNERSDNWNLDGPESQSQRHSNGQDYDPTYTNQPAHGGNTSNSGNDLVHIGPWDSKGGGAVIVDDFPGLLERDHNRFAQQGGWIEWEFITLLLCKEETGSAAHYLANGKVRAKTRFKVRRTYPIPTPNNQTPTVSGTLLKGAPEGRPTYYRRCRDLSDVLREMRLANAFNNPRTHRIQLQ